MKYAIKGILIVATIAYPFLVFWGAKHWGAQFFQFALLVLAACYFISARSGNAISWLWVGICLILSSWLAFSEDILPAKLYPVAISLGLCSLFFLSLFNPPTVVERIARLQDPDLPPEGVVYTRNVTKVWIAFFMLNASASAATSVFFSDEVWLLYNGMVSYIIMGCIFAIEWGVRQKVKKRFSSEKEIATHTETGNHAE